MKRLARLGSLLLLIVVAGHSAFAHGTAPVQQLSVARGDPIKEVNQASYYVGYHLMFARYLTLRGSLGDAAEEIKHISPAFSGQDEIQLQSCLEMISKGASTRDEIHEVLKKVASSLESRLAGDVRWFYDFGKTYASLFITADYLRETNDAGPFRQILIDLGKLATTAPSDAPASVVASLTNLGGIGVKAQASVDDFAVIKKSIETIDSSMVA
jgi:hypothetical protein